MKKLLITFATIILLIATPRAQVITTIAGNGTAGYTGNGGPAINALISHPNQLAFDQSGNLFIAEDYNNVIRKIDTNGNIILVGGTGTAGFNGDGLQATSTLFNRSCGVAVDLSGNIYVCDANNYRIRKINTSGIVSTIAGTGTSGYSGDGFAATNAEIGFSSGICVDPAGNIYFASQNPGYCVRKINTSGIISTVAGTGVSGYNGEGIAADTAKLNSPAAVFLDAAGNLFIGDLGGMRIRKVNTSGIINTVAGNGSTASGGDNGPATSAQLLYPYGMVADAAGNLYICESVNNKIRKVDASGTITTFAGVGGLVGGYGGNGGSPLLAQLYHPSAITLDASGNIYIGDFENDAIRKITMNTNGINEDFFSDESISKIYPNPSNDFLTIESKVVGEKSIQIFNITGGIVTNLNSTEYVITIDLKSTEAGLYTMRITNNNKVENRKLIIVK